jgi:hypothetical protein
LKQFEKLFYSFLASPNSFRPNSPSTLPIFFYIFLILFRAKPISCPTQEAFWLTWPTLPSSSSGHPTAAAAARSWSCAARPVTPVCCEAKRCPNLSPSRNGVGLIDFPTCKDFMELHSLPTPLTSLTGRLPPYK